MQRVKNLYQIALNTVPKPQGKERVLYNEGLTKDIETSILQVFESNYQQTKDFARNFKGKDLGEIHRFVRQNIRYKIDARGTQHIKTPAAVIHSKIADCKGYSILIASILQNLGIDFVFRFVNFKAGDFTHVYIVANPQTQPYILDACMPSPNTEKRYFNKKDMRATTKISEISGVQNNYDNYDSYAPYEQYTSIAGFYNYEFHNENYNDLESRNYHNEVPEVGNIFKKVWGGIKNAATFVGDKVLKPIAKPLLSVAELALDIIPVPGSGLLKKGITLAGKVLTVVDKSTGLVKAIDTGNPAGIVEAISEINKTTQGKKYTAMTEEEKAIATKRATLFQKGFELATQTGDTAALEKLKALKAEVSIEEVPNPAGAADMDMPTTTVKKTSSNTPLLIGAAVTAYFLTQGKGKKRK